MSTMYQELAERIRGEVPDLDRIVRRAQRSWPQAQRTLGDQDVYVDSVALNLHSFYSGLERLFELIARHMDRTFPTGENWHRDLLQQMADDKTNVRPAVVGQDSLQALDEFRRFPASIGSDRSEQQRVRSLSQLRASHSSPSLM